LAATGPTGRTNGEAEVRGVENEVRPSDWTDGAYRATPWPAGSEMADVLIVGGGICGLGTALLLARDGHEVSVIERDADPVPNTAREAWDTWARKGVAQFRQPHNFMPGLRLILEAELPDVRDALPRAGACRLDFVNPLPPFFADQSSRPLDEKLWTYTARRPAGEWVFADAARTEPRVRMRRGVQAAGLLTGPSATGGVPHVVGVRTASGAELRADVVVDAMGRRSRSPEWLAAIGARPPYEEQADCGFTYYTRYFSGTEPQRIGPVFTPLGTIAILTLPGDNGTWSVTIMTASGDQPLKSLRHTEKWMSAVRACPLQAHWLDGEPITDILAMSGVVDRYRRFVVEGAPVATGFVAVADAWACTNPSAGRGLTVGIMHAVRLRDALRAARDDPRALAEEFHEMTEADVAPWYHAQIAADRARFAQIEALRAGREPPPPVDELSEQLASLFATMAADPDLFRAGLEYIGTITPIQEIFQRPAVAEGVHAVTEATRDSPPMVMPGPNREQLLDLVK
jgi:2-polyprenyl-6-methoxyphenol hydroxylase-like FAD-dependent oxidoreductase